MVSSRSALLLLASGLVACSAALLGCADPEGDFNDFTERYGKISTATDTGTGTGTNACTLPEAGAADGDFLLTLSAKLNPQKPFVFLAKVTTESMGDGLGVSLNVQPLRADDRTTLVGEAVDVGPYEIAADGSLLMELPTLSIPGEANPITGNPIEATATLTGTVCAPGEFVCGDVTGQAKSGALTLKLDGSTYTLQKVTDSTYPVAVINCAGEEAPLE
jgi:hypothetical protein